jgi:hypothetical protein
MSEVTEQIKSEYKRVEKKLISLLNSTPADKLEWSPSPSARSVIALAAHSAMGTTALTGLLKGEPMRFNSTAELDAFLREAEKQFTNLDVVLGMIKQSGEEYFAFLDTLDADTINAIVTTPMGAMPMSVAATFPYEHMNSHVAQIEYVQTIWGDHVWRS